MLPGLLLGKGNIPRQAYAEGQHTARFATFVRQLRRMRRVAPVIVCTSAPAEATPLVPPGVRVISKWTDLKELRAAVSSFCVEPGHRL